MFNAVKHDQAGRARISLRPVQDGIRLIVSDQGRDSDAARLTSEGDLGSGFGLFSIRERIGLIGGVLRTRTVNALRPCAGPVRSASITKDAPPTI